MIRRSLKRRAGRAPGWLLLLAAAGCFGLSDQEQELLIIHQQNSKLYYDRGDYGLAIQQCRLGLQLSPGDETLQLTLAYSLLRTSTRESTEEAYEILDSMEGWFGSSDFRVVLGQGIASLSLYRHYQDSEPELAESYREEARDLLEEATEMAPDSIEAYYHLSLLDLELGDLDRFLEHSGQTLVLLESSIRLKDRTIDKVEREEQRELISRDRRIAADRGRQLVRLRSAILYRRDRIRDALEELARLESVDGLERPDYFNRARLHEELGELELAVDDYETFLDLSERSSDTNVEMAMDSLFRLRAQLAERRVSSSTSDSEP
jgi:tetratricopeptide (TPR) repeat protein